MKASLIRFAYKYSNWDPCKGYEIRKGTGVALLVENGSKKVVVIERSSGGIGFFRLLDENDELGRFVYDPPDPFAILPKTDYQIIEDVTLPDDVLATILEGVELQKRISEANKSVLGIIRQSCW